MGDSQAWKDMKGESRGTGGTHSTVLCLRLDIILQMGVMIINDNLLLKIGSLAGKGSTCNAGDPGSIPRSGRSPGEGIGYPLQYSWAPLIAQMVNNLPVI